MPIVAGIIEVSPRLRREAFVTFKNFIQEARKEIGNLAYHIPEGFHMSDYFRFYEVREAKEALVHHLKSENTSE